MVPIIEIYCVLIKVTMSLVAKTCVYIYTVATVPTSFASGSVKLMEKWVGLN